MRMFLSVLLLFVLVTIGCAHLNYVKVPTPTQYSNWTDEQQKKADSMKGVRYYLPRPFLHLKQSIPVAQRVALISFHYDENAKGYVVDKPENAPSWLRKALPEKLSVTQALALTLSGREQEQKAVTGAKEEAAPAGGAETGEKPKEKPQPEAKPPSELRAQTGFINATDPVTRLGDRMDVVYLPDFEEQYVIQPHTGLGVADIETKLRNGWAAEVFSNKVDNSNLVPYVINQFERASDVASGIATTWAPMLAGVPAPSISKILRAKVPSLEAAPAGLPEATAIKDFLGNVLLFKIAEVKIAQPGLYPILKPREIKQWLKYSGIVAGPDEDVAFSSFLLQSQAPWIRQDVAFIPCPPFTMIAFNATTDVFITPATSRLAELDSNNDGKGDTSPQNEDINTKELEEKVKKSLIARLDKHFTDDLRKVFVTNLEKTLTVKSSREETKVTIINAGLTEQQQKKEDFQAWIKDSLETVKKDELIAVVFKESGNIIEITIKLPIAKL